MSFYKYKEDWGKGTRSGGQGNKVKFSKKFTTGIRAFAANMDV